MSKTYIGIDVGLKGGIAFLIGTEAGFKEPTGMSRLPLVASGKRQEVDTRELWGIIARNAPNLETIMVVVEECSHHQPSQAAMRSQALSYGKILGMLEQHSVSYHTVLPQKWQGVVIGKIPKGMTKLAAQGKAKRIWPKMAGSFGEKDDGITDACLLAAYGRVENL